MRLEFWENQNFDLLVVLDEKLSVDYREIVVVVCSNVVVLACPWWKVAAWVILYYKKLMDVAEALSSPEFLCTHMQYATVKNAFFPGCELIRWCINDESRFCTMFTLTADPCFMQPQPTRKTSDTDTVKKPSLYWRVKQFNPSQGQKV